MKNKIKYVLPLEGKLIRNSVFPNKPLDQKIPTKVLWNSYWERRKLAKDIKIVDETEGQAVSDEFNQVEVDDEIKTEKKSKKAK